MKAKVLSGLDRMDILDTLLKGQRVGLVTAGSQLQWAYSRAFPAVVPHDSLRDLYEVTGTELDTMVEEARKIPGTLGSRMTGAGFGGCTVSLVKEEDVDLFIEQVGQNYEARTGLKPEFYVADAGQGAGRVDAPIEFLV